MGSIERSFFEKVLRRVPAGLLGVDLTGVVRVANQEARRSMGDELADITLVSLFRPDVRTAAEAYLVAAACRAEGTSYFRGRVVRRDGAERVVELTAANLLDEPDVALLLLAVRDVTEQVEREEQLTRAAMVDALTGLPNRALLLDRLQQQRPHGAVVAMIDLDGFKQVNDVHGHAAGDRLLVTLSARIAEVLPEEVTVARFGGDEFAVLLPGGISAAQDVMAVVLAEISRPVELAADTLRQFASVGIAEVMPGQVPEQALADADRAMYQAKAAGGNRAVVYGPAMHQWVADRRQAGTTMAKLRDENERLAHESRTDALTGLGNRRALDEALDRLSASSARSGRPYAVLFVDIDRFGAYNHFHGDAAGDRVLTRVAGTLETASRGADTAFRKGGEEMVLLLPDTEPDEASGVAERLRASVEQLAIPHGGHPGCPVVTVTVGIADAGGGSAAEETLEAAAVVAYEAKDSDRRNQVARG